MTTQISMDQAQKIAACTSSIYEQGGRWVFREWNLESGVEKRTRGLSHTAATQMLEKWRREQIETLLRDNKDGCGYALKVWHENPSWNGAGIWQWAQKAWYTTRDEAEKAMILRQENSDSKFEIFELPIPEIPGSFMAEA